MATHSVNLRRFSSLDCLLSMVQQIIFLPKLVLSFQYKRIFSSLATISPKFSPLPTAQQAWQTVVLCLLSLKTCLWQQHYTTIVMFATFFTTAGKTCSKLVGLPLQPCIFLRPCLLIREELLRKNKLLSSNSMLNCYMVQVTTVEILRQLNH